MNRKKVVFISHCVLNIASKVIRFNEDLGKPEEELRKKFILESIEREIQFVQLPCPEFTLYGSKRWGHVKDQFDNPFFRDHCKKILVPIIQQMKEYDSQKKQFEVLGIIGINGSPSCGVTYTCKGQWGGEFSSQEDIASVISTIERTDESGVMIEVLKEMLEQSDLNIRIIGLDSKNPEEIFKLIGVI